MNKNTLAREVRSSKYRQRVVRSRKVYTRKRKHHGVLCASSLD